MPDSTIPDLSAVNANTGHLIPVAVSAGVDATRVSIDDISRLLDTGSFKVYDPSIIFTDTRGNSYGRFKVFNGNTLFSGSNNRVVIEGNLYPNKIIAGNGGLSNNSGNTAQGQGASVLGGSGNHASGLYGSVVNGFFNKIASAVNYAVVGAGTGNFVNSHYGSILAGLNNTITNSESSSIINGDSNTITPTIAAVANFIGGGFTNIVRQGSYCFIGGGYGNSVSGSESCVVAGISNSAHAADSFIGAGQGNLAGNRAGHFANVVVGGWFNSGIGGGYNFVGGGHTNIAYDGSYNAMVGGFMNTISGSESFIGGGENNYIEGNISTIGGGGNNKIKSSSNYSFIGAGLSNLNSGAASSILGGAANTIGSTCIYSQIIGSVSNSIIDAERASILGGEFNRIGGNNAGDYSVIIGGNTTNISGDYCLAWGGNTSAVHQGATVLSDSRLTVNKKSFVTDSLNLYYQGGYLFSGGASNDINITGGSTNPARLFLNGNIITNNPSAPSVTYKNPGRIYIDYVNKGNVASNNETKVKFYTYKANTLSNNGDSLKFRCYGDTLAQANSTLNFSGGGIPLGSFSAIGSLNSWLLDIDFIRSGSTTMKYNLTFTKYLSDSASSLTQVSGGSVTFNMATDQEINVNAANNTANNINSHSLTVDYIPAP
jgi:hypothetical protein